MNLLPFCLAFSRLSNLATLKLPLSSDERILFIYKSKTRQKSKTNDFYKERKKDPLNKKRPQAITCMHCTCLLFFFNTDRWRHRASSPTKHLPDSTLLCFHPFWHQVGICRFFNICRPLQTAALAKFPQQGQVELMRMIAQPLNQIWGFNISWMLDKTWALFDVSRYK